MMMWHYGPWTNGAWSGWWWMMPFHGLFSLLVLLIVVGGVFALFRGKVGRNRRARSPALDALQERYAKGEIQREEYLQKKNDLGA